MLGILALGVGILMIAGEFDLSIGAVFIFSPYMVALAYTIWGWPIGVAILFGFFCAAVIGLINGVITVYLRLPSFIATLGMLFILRHGIRFVFDNRTIEFRPDESFDNLMTGSIGGIVQAQFLWFLGLAFVLYLLLNRHRVGNHFLTVGGNREAAVSVGININRTKMIAFVICAMCAGLAGLISITRTHGIELHPQLYLELKAIAICVMGGLFLTGGRGSVLGIVLGACVLEMVRDTLLLSRAPGYYLDVFLGLVIVVAVALNTWAAKRY